MYIMANVAIGNPYVLNAIVVAEVIRHQTRPLVQPRHRARNTAHPVWSRGTIFQMVEWTFETDQRIVHLLTLVNDAFTFIRNVGSLRAKFTSLQEPISGLLKQTAECCIFVRHYTSLFRVSSHLRASDRL